LKASKELPKKFNRDLLSFKDICLNGNHIETNNERDIKYIYITRIELNKKNKYWRNELHKKCVLEKLSTFFSDILHIY